MERYLSTAVTSVVVAIIAVAALNYYGLTCSASGFGSGGHTHGDNTADHEHPVFE